MQRSTHHSQQWDGWGSDRPLRPSSPSPTLPPPHCSSAYGHLRFPNKAPPPWLPSTPLWSCSNFSQNVDSGSAPACVHRRVILGSPLGSTHGHHLSATLAGCLESRCPFCIVLHLLRLISPFTLSPGRQSMALLSDADAAAACHCLHFKIRKA